MTSETAKALLMIAMFGGLQFALHFPRICELYRILLREAAGLVTSVAPGGSHVLQPVWARRASRQR